MQRPPEALHWPFLVQALEMRQSASVAATQALPDREQRPAAEQPPELRQSWELVATHSPFLAAHLPW